jgi:ubiquinone/menaquinone biosynthesis C-methylase UbiE
MRDTQLNKIIQKMERVLKKGGTFHVIVQMERHGIEYSCYGVAPDGHSNTGIFLASDISDVIQKVLIAFKTIHQEKP